MMMMHRESSKRGLEAQTIPYIDSMALQSNRCFYIIMMMTILMTMRMMLIIDTYDEMRVMLMAMVTITMTDYNDYD